MTTLTFNTYKKSLKTESPIPRNIPKMLQIIRVLVDSLQKYLARAHHKRSFLCACLALQRKCFGALNTDHQSKNQTKYFMSIDQ